MYSLENLSFSSFEAFIAQVFPEESANPHGRSHDYISQQLIKLKKMAQVLKIDLAFFQRGKQYFVTPGASSLFLDLLKLYDEPYGRKLRKGDFTAIPTEQLVRVRAHLYDALMDAHAPLEQRLEQIRRFDLTTGCPPRVLFGRLSEPVQESILQYQEEHPQTELDWGSISEVVEFDYLQNLKPQLMESLKQSIAQAIKAEEMVDRAVERVLQKKTSSPEAPR